MTLSHKTLPGVVDTSWDVDKALDFIRCDYVTKVLERFTSLKDNEYAPFRDTMYLRETVQAVVKVYDAMGGERKDLKTLREAKKSFLANFPVVAFASENMAPSSWDKDSLARLAAAVSSNRATVKVVLRPPIQPIETNADNNVIADRSETFITKTVSGFDTHVKLDNKTMEPSPVGAIGRYLKTGLVNVLGMRTSSKSGSNVEYLAEVNVFATEPSMLHNILERSLVDTTGTGDAVETNGGGGVHFSVTDNDTAMQAFVLHSTFVSPGNCAGVRSTDPDGTVHPIEECPTLLKTTDLGTWASTGMKIAGKSLRALMDKEIDKLCSDPKNASTPFCDCAARNNPLGRYYKTYSLLKQKAAKDRPDQCWFRPCRESTTSLIPSAVDIHQHGCPTLDCLDLVDVQGNAEVDIGAVIKSTMCSASVPEDIPVVPPTPDNGKHEDSEDTVESDEDEYYNPNAVWWVGGGVAALMVVLFAIVLVSR